MAWLNENRRVWALTLATALVASGIGLGVALIGGDGPPASTPRPTESPEATTSPPPTPTASPAASPTATPTRSPAATPLKTAPPAQDAANVDCDQTPTFCTSSTGRMTITDGRLSSNGKTDHSTNYANLPRTTMTWRFLQPGGTEADNGDEVERLRVTVLVENGTSDRTFVFPRREIALQLTRNADNVATAPSRGDPLDLPPGGSFEISFDQPITADGAYEWRGKTWFYEK